jgi:DNA-binding transcriptional MocR family regulator
MRSLGNANAAIILSSLISKFNYFEGKGEIENGSFFNTKEMISNDTGLSEESILRAEKLLEDKGYITTKLRGLPRKKYYTLQWDFIAHILQGTVPVTQIEREQHNTDNTTDTPQVTLPIEHSERILQNISGNDNHTIIINNKNQEIKTNKKKQMMWDDDDEILEPYSSSLVTQLLSQGKTYESVKSMYPGYSSEITDIFLDNF